MNEQELLKKYRSMGFKIIETAMTTHSNRKGKTLYTRIEIYYNHWEQVFYKDIFGMAIYDTTPIIISEIKSFIRNKKLESIGI